MVHHAGGGTGAAAIVAFPDLALGVAFMNAPMTRNQFSFSLGELTYIDSNHEEEATLFLVSSSHKQRAIKWWTRLVVDYTEWRHRRAVIQEMAMMSDRQLSDIGLSRSDLAGVFSPTFAANHARGGDCTGY
jgi:uncharacterized protein YjiS (DUF1127 family)